MAKKKTLDSDTPVSKSALLNIQKKFDLSAFKQKKGFDKHVQFKEQEFIPVSTALQEAISIPGIPKGHITLLRGHSDTGKSTLLNEVAISAQQNNILPVFIITEMKFSWEHLKEMGFQMEDVVDTTTGEIVGHEGFFLYKDRSTLNTIEDMASFINDILVEQKNGNLPYDLLFLVDSIGSIPAKMCVEHGKVNNEWNAGAYAQQFGNFINQQIPLSRKAAYPYTNTMVCVNKVWVAKPTVPMGQPKMKNKGGDTFFYDSTFVITFGNITNSGTSKLSATKNKKNVEFAKRTKVSCDKNHFTGIQTKGVIIVTKHGFIKDTPGEITKYKNEHSNEWVDILGVGPITITEDNSEWEESKDSIPMGLISIDEDNED